MEQIIFDTLVNTEFTGDYKLKCDNIAQAEAQAAADGAGLDKALQNEIAGFNADNKAFKAAADDRIAQIEQKTANDLAAADAKYNSDVNECQGRINDARKAFDKANKACENKKLKLEQASEKVNADIEKKYKAELAAEDKRYAADLRTREKDFKEKNDAFNKKLAELKAGYDKEAADVKERINAYHANFFAQDEANANDYQAIKQRCEEKINERQTEYKQLQAAINDEIKDCTDKQKLKMLKNQLAAGKNSCDSAVAALRNEIATGKKVFEVKHSEEYAHLVSNVTAQQKRLRNAAAQLNFDKSELSYKQRISEAENQNRVIAEDRIHSDKIAEIELWRQDELNKEYSRVFCDNYDIDIEFKQARCEFDVDIEEENKNMALHKLSLEESCRIIEIDRETAFAEQQKNIKQNNALTDTSIQRQAEQCYHGKQIIALDIYSLGLKYANSDEKLINMCKQTRVENMINAQIARVQQRLSDDLKQLGVSRDYQEAEYQAILATNASFYNKQHETVQKLLDVSTAAEKQDEVAIFTRAIENIEKNRLASEESLKAQASAIENMIVAEELRVKEQAQKELAALEKYLQACVELTDKQNSASDALAAKADEQKKDTVVELLATYENRLAQFEQGYQSVLKATDDDFVALDKKNIVEKEKFVQETEEKKAQEQKECVARQDDLKAKQQSCVNEAEKNKTISKGMLGEQLNKSAQKLQANKNEYNQLVAQKSNELKTFVGACNRAVADAKKDLDRKFNDNDKLRIKEEKWLLKNGAVDAKKEWWVVNFG